jgi:hypothetical protein
MTILALTPRGDYAADTVAQWGTQALQKALYTPYIGHEIDVLTLRAAVGTTSFIFYFGHGGVDRWIECAAIGTATPSVVRTIVEVPDADCLKSSVVFAFACESGVQLGPAAVAQGAQRFIGFQRTLYWYPYSKRMEGALAETVKELVQVVLTRGASATAADLQAPIQARHRYFLDLSSRGDADAGTIANILAILIKALTLH